MKTVFITGAASGIGRATAEFFASKGWNVATTVRREAQLEMFRHLPNVRTYLLEVTDFAQVSTVAEQVMRDCGKVDVVVNNAGFAQYGPLETSSMEQIKAQFETNYFGVVSVCKAFIPHLREQRSGTIVNVASLSAKMGFPIFSVYSSSKAAVATLSEALAIELAPFQIKVKTVFPGTHATQIFNKMDAGLTGDYKAYLPYIKNFLDAQRGVTKVSAPGEIAALIWHAVTDDRERYEYIGGHDAGFLVGLKRILPQAMWKRLQVNTLLRSPTRIQLRFLNSIMRGTHQLETTTDARLQ